MKRIFEDWLDDIGPIEQKNAAVAVADDNEDELLPDDDHFTYHLFFATPKLKQLKARKSIEKAIERGTSMIRDAFDITR